MVVAGKDAATAHIASVFFLIAFKGVGGRAGDFQKFFLFRGIHDAVGHDSGKIRSGSRMGLYGSVASCGGGVEAVWRDKISIKASDIPGFLVHHLSKGFHAPRDVFCNDNG